MTSAGGKRKLRRAALLLGVVASIVSCCAFINQTLFNAWLAAYHPEAPYLADVRARFWTFGSLSVVFLALAIYLAVVLVRSAERA